MAKRKKSKNIFKLMTQIVTILAVIVFAIGIWSLVSNAERGTIWMITIISFIVIIIGILTGKVKVKDLRN